MRGIFRVPLLLLLVIASTQAQSLRASGEEENQSSRQLQNANALPRKEIRIERSLPKGRCEGDCDHDRECARGLVCFMRSGGEDISNRGCTGGGKFPSVDVCVPDPRLPPPQQRPQQSQELQQRPPQQQHQPNSGSGPSFRLKMYYDNYCWQEECFDPQWCAFYDFQRPHCYYNNDDEGPCLPDRLYVEKCGRNNAGKDQFRFVETGGGRILVQAAQSTGQQQCLQRYGTNILLRPCNAGNLNQKWKSPRGSYNGNFFEFSIDGSRCMTQHHHPKGGELIELVGCRPERDTTLWEKVWN